MQDRYVGDVGDFGKYGLLRAINSQPTSRLGVVWCLFPNELHNSDGRHIGYLNKPDFRELDPDLFDRLAAIIRDSRRSVAAVAMDAVLPGTAAFFAEPIALSGTPPRAVRDAHRTAWLERSLAATAGCETVFFDPDNGLETPSVPRHSPKGGKYVFWSELEAFWQRGQSLIVYHHTNRTVSVGEQVKRLKARFEDRYQRAGLLRCLLFRKGSCRLFWIVAQSQHATSIAATIEGFLTSGFGRLFEEV